MFFVNIVGETAIGVGTVIANDPADIKGTQVQVQTWICEIGNGNGKDAFETRVGIILLKLSLEKRTANDLARGIIANQRAGTTVLNQNARIGRGVLFNP